MTPAPHHWKQTIIHCIPGYEDIITALAFEAGFSGVVEETSAEGPRLIASYDADLSGDPPLSLRESLESLEPRDGVQPAHIIAHEDIPQRDWESSWREGLSATETGRRLVIRPSWVSYSNRENRIEVIIDPKMAFGTGQHATTALCLEALEGFDLRGMRVIDAGTGSGVLSIAAVKLGAQEAHGFDNDEWSVENARENAVLNSVADRITVDLADLLTWHAQPADIILANLISGVLIPNLAIFRYLLKPLGAVVFSGLLFEEEAAFAKALVEGGFSVGPITRRDEWIAVQARLAC